MRLLVTGANGYLGQFLCPYLLSLGHELTTLTRHPYHLTGANNQRINPARLVESLQGQEVVIHLAAKAHQSQDNSEEVYQDYLNINLGYSLSLAQAACAAGVKRFIYISSIKVNGEETSSQPFRSTDLPNPQDAYGRSKWEAEQALRHFVSDKAMELVVVRPPLIWGGDMKGNLALLRRWVSMGVPLPFAGLNNRRDLVSLANMSRFVVHLLDHPRAAEQPWLVSDGVPRSTPDIVRLVTADIGRAKLFSCPAAVLNAMMRVPAIGRRLKKLTANLELDITPSREVLDWRPEGSEK